MKCHNCGSEIPEQSVFCGMCGTRVKPESIPVTEPEPRIDEPESIPAEPIIEPVTIPTEPEPKVDEPESIPVTEPEIDNPVTIPTEPEPKVDEPESESKINEAAAEPETTANDTAANGGYAYRPQTNPYGGASVRHCTYCGAVLMNGANFCSNCGNYVTAYEPQKQKKGVGKLIAAIAAVIALLAIISGITFALSGHDIEGEWVVENNNDMFGMFGESYLDFDDGTALYYNGLFSAQRYTYSYNRFTKILTLRGKGTDEYTRVHVEWHGNNTVVLPELDMTIMRIDDIPYEYSDDEYDSDDVIQF